MATETVAASIKLEAKYNSQRFAGITNAKLLLDYYFNIHKYRKTCQKTNYNHILFFCAQKYLKKTRKDSEMLS